MDKTQLTTKKDAGNNENFELCLNNAIKLLIRDPSRKYDNYPINRSPN
jgi:hypothetical protein